MEYQNGAYDMTIKIGASGGGLIMPSYATTGTALLYLKSAATTVPAANSAAFWTAIDLTHTPLGWESVKLIAAADTTEQTILDITDAGVVTSVVAPELRGAGTMTIRITADGNETTYVSETLATGQRFCVGAFLPTVPQSANSTYVGAAGDAGFNLTTTALALITPIQALTLGISGIKFETSLKVTIQGSVNISAAAELENAAVCHSLFIPEGL
jgi:hypothetical protein